jgi:hypothetical protein
MPPTAAWPSIQWPYNRDANQLRRFQHLGASKYQIAGSAAGRALDVAAGAVSDSSKVQLRDCVAGANQIRRVTPVDNRYSRLCPSHAPGSSLDVQAQGAEVRLRQYLGGANQ